jgi:hypothetical protein
LGFNLNGGFGIGNYLFQCFITGLVLVETAFGGNSNVFLVGFCAIFQTAKSHQSFGLQSIGSAL